MNNNPEGTMTVINEAMEMLQRDLRKLTAEARLRWGDKAEVEITIRTRRVQAYAHDGNYTNAGHLYEFGNGDTAYECLADLMSKLDKIPLPPTDADIAATLGIPYPLAAE